MTPSRVARSGVRIAAFTTTTQAAVTRRRLSPSLSRIPRAGRACVVLILLAALCLGATARAEVPPLSDADMQSGAELIATEFVTGVSEKDDTSYPVRGQKLVRGTWTITIQVETVEKAQLAPGDKQVSLTAERNVAVPKGWLGGTDRFRLTLQPGDEVKLYLGRGKAGDLQLIHHLGLWMCR